jgi:hypothetical protein
VHRYLLLTGLLSGCGATHPGAPTIEPTAKAASTSSFHVVAEGPCAKLSVQTIAPRTFVVYGDTGYDLHDWTAGERLAAAQSAVELRDGEAFHVRGLFEGLPSNAGGYVPADLRFGGAFAERPWLVTVDTSYAPRAKGSLFERASRGWLYDGHAWHPTPDAASPVELPAGAGQLPPLPESAMCEAGARFVKLAATTHPKGTVFFAGRCETGGPVLAARAPIWIASADTANPAPRWSTHRAPESHVLDGVVNVALWARRHDDAYLVAYEPFKPPEERQPYLARFDGRSWSQIETGLPEGLMSVSGTGDGTLWIAAGRALYVRRPEGVFTPVPLPPLRFASNPHPPTLRIHTVRALAPDDVWVEGTYRLRAPPPRESKSREPMELRASVLYRSRAGATHFCDAREPVPSSFTRVDP